MSGQLSLREARTKRQKNNSYISSRRTFRASMKASRNEREAAEDENNTQRKKLKKENVDTDEELKVETGEEATTNKGKEDETEVKNADTEENQDGGATKPKFYKEETDSVAVENVSDAEVGKGVTKGNDNKDMLSAGGSAEKSEHGNVDIMKENKKSGNKDGEGSGKTTKGSDKAGYASNSSNDSDIFTDTGRKEVADRDYQKFLKLEKEGAFCNTSNSESTVYDIEDDEEYEKQLNMMKKNVAKVDKKGGKTTRDDKNDDEENEDDNDDDEDDEDDDGDDDDDMNDDDMNEDGKNDGDSAGNGGGNPKMGGEGNDDDYDEDSEMDENSDAEMGSDGNKGKDGKCPKTKQKNFRDDVKNTSDGALNDFEGCYNRGTLTGPEYTVGVDTEDEISDDKSDIDSVPEKAIGDLNIADEQYEALKIGEEDGGLGTSGSESKPDSSSDEDEKQVDFDIAGALDPYEMDFDDDDEPSIDEDYYEFLSQDGGSGGEDENSYYEDGEYVEEVEEVRGTG